MRLEQIKSAGTEIGVAIYFSLLTTYHDPTAKKIPENQQKYMYYILKTKVIYSYVEVC